MNKNELIEKLMKLKGNPEIRVQIPYDNGTMGLGGEHLIKKQGRVLYIGLNPQDRNEDKVFKGEWELGFPV